MTTTRTILLASLLALPAVCLPSVCSADVRLLARPSSGELQFGNAGLSPVNLAGYSILSPNESLLAGDWTPIAGRLDLTGGGGFDSAADWIQFPSDDGELAEGAFSGPGGQLTPGATVSIGPAWHPPVAMDLSAEAIVDGVSTTLTVVYTPVGDYDWDGDVDIDDYGVFTTTFGSTTDLRADGNDDGIVDVADFTIWRDALGAASMPALPSISLTPTPEPASSLLLLLSLLALPRRRRGRD